MDDLYRKQILTKRIFITADKLGKDIDKTIKEKFPSCFSILDERIYGVSKIIFGKY